LSANGKKDLDLARDDLMSHIMRCGVLKAQPEHQVEWLDETVEYLGECYPELGAPQLAELKAIGVRFCQPVIPHGKGNTALTTQAEVASDSEDEAQELAGV
jgi:hypothetical protein